MDVQITEAEKCTRQIEITLSGEEVNPKFEQTLRNYRKKINLDGFRAGKAPLSLLKKMYGEAIRQKTVEDMLPALLKDIRAKHELKPVGPAQIEEIEFKEDSSLKVRATIEVEPEVDLQEYKNFEIEKINYSISDNDIEKALQDLREHHGWLESVESAAQDGYIVTADIQMVDQSGLPLIGHNYGEKTLKIAEKSKSQDDFTSQLIGVKAGESRIVKVPRQNPEDKDIFYQVEVKDVSEKKLPALDDELARDVGEFETLDELRQQISKDLENRARTQSEEDVANRIMDEIIRRNPIDLPQGLVEYYGKVHLDSFKKIFEDVDENELKRFAHSRAERELKWLYLSGEIKEKENIEVDDETLRQYIASAEESREGGNAQRQINKIMNNEDERERLRGRLLDEKIMQFLISNMKISEHKVPYSDLGKSKIITP